MSRPDLTKLLNEPPMSAKEPSATKAKTEKPVKERAIHKPDEVNISAYFLPEVKAALRQVQAKNGKTIKGCLTEALQLLFRKYNVPVAVRDE